MCSIRRVLVGAQPVLEGAHPGQEDMNLFCVYSTVWPRFLAVSKPHRSFFFNMNLDQGLCLPLDSCSVDFWVPRGWLYFLTLPWCAFTQGVSVMALESFGSRIPALFPSFGPWAGYSL